MSQGTCLACLLDGIRHRLTIHNRMCSIRTEERESEKFDVRLFFFVPQQFPCFDCFTWRQWLHGGNAMIYTRSPPP